MPNYLSMDPNAGSESSGGESPGFEFDTSDVQSGTSSSRRALQAMELARAGVPTGMQPIAATEPGQERDEARRTLIAASALPLLAGAGPVASFAATPGGGAVTNAALKAAQGGDIGDIAKAGAYGAVGGGIGGKLLPFLLRLRGAAPAIEAAIPAVSAEAGAAASATGAEAVPATAQLAQRLKQMAEQSGANRAAVKEIIRQAFPPEMVKQMEDFILNTARTRL